MSSLLSSDILESQFGPTKVFVLHQDAAARIICTRSVADGQVLELSYIMFVTDGARKFPGTHQSVLDGRSMGKAFRADGIEFRRDESRSYRFSLPDGFEKWFGSNQSTTVVAVSILAGPDETPYAKILEVYSPAVVWPQLKGQAEDKDSDTIKLMDEFLLSRAAVR